MTLTALCLCVAISISAQEAAAPADRAARVCIFDIQDIAPAGDTARYGDIITEALEAGLRNILQLDVIPEEAWRKLQGELELTQRSLVLAGGAVTLAGAAGADLAVTGFYRVERDRILVEIKCYNVRQKRLIAGFLERGRPGLSIYNLVNEAVLAIQPAIEADAVSLRDLIRPSDPRLARVELLSDDEGAEVSYAGGKPAGRIVDGRMELTAARGRELVLEVRKKGFHPGRAAIAVADEPTQSHVLPPLVRATVWAAELSYTLGQMLGVGMGARYYPLPDRLFIGLRDYLYVQHEFERQSRPVLHNDTELLVGVYPLTEPDSLFRFGVSTGLGVIVTGFSAPDMPVFTDVYWNVLSGWLEINLRDWAFSLRVDGKYGLDIGENVLAGQWYLVEDSVPPLSLGVARKW